ncbi:hypothetical protein [Psychrobacillus sp. OK032]|uniref:hypothetical protein n=1 Tax=Psychrobacillus sp. OK032 TaxID=1884358 RepID=UPI0008D6799C|nr:hypothetical protein [Psychrobacillus sp. OK032]SER88060.1 hypothetical protein SAMN05518872_102473 [Psychrobacillus sp. OK032]
MKTAAAVVGGIVLFAMILFISPLIALFVGFLVGFIIELTTGNYATDSLNVIFGTERFVHGDFARLTAIAAVIGTFFTTAKSSSKTKEAAK